MKWSLLLIFTINSFASIFGVDDRVETLDAPDYIQKVAKSALALIPSKRMVKMGESHFKLQGQPLTKSMGFCEETRFASQKLIANCSGALIAPNKVLTAAHCISTKVDDGYNCKDYSFVFDYKKDNAGDLIINKKNVYRCKKIIQHVDDFFTTMKDFAVVELDRNVEGREPLKVNYNFNYQNGHPVYVIGHPYGIYQKFADNGEIINVKPKINSFRHDLDTFSVNSGSPIFDARTNDIIGIHVRGTNGDNGWGESCHHWPKATYGKDYGEANFTSIIAPVK